MRKGHTYLTLRLRRVLAKFNMVYAASWRLAGPK